MMSIKPRLIVTALLSAAILASCGSMRNTATVSKTHPAGNTGQQQMEIPSNLPAGSHALLAEAKQWLGTPYKYGGNDRNGIDCSALVLNVYRSALDIKLPRSSSEQARFCSPLAKGELMPGDLLFFATGSRGKISHVGIYIGDNRMIHSSSSKGVIISDIDSNYFQRTFAGAGYVKQYHAMLGKSPSPPDDDSPFVMTPVSSLPSRVTTTSDSKTSGTKSPGKKNSVKNNPEKKNSGNNKKNAGLTPDDARREVLNSLIEQKIDSIFNR